MGILLRNSESHLQNEVSYKKRVANYFWKSGAPKLSPAPKNPPCPGGGLTPSFARYIEQDVGAETRFGMS